MDLDEFKVIEFNMLKKGIFFPLSGLSSLTVHTIIYPMTLVRTRLQLQSKHTLYKGMIHATRKIVAEEGWKGLYSGYFVKTIQIVSGVFYIATYEWSRLKLADYGLSPAVRSGLAGFAASVVGQTIVVPIDVVSQHLMVLSGKSHNGSVRNLSPLMLTDAEMVTSLSRTKNVIKKIHHLYGPIGFYKGYWVSLFTFAPNSALWWLFYNRYCDLISTYVFPDTQRLYVQILSSPLAAITSSVIMNPVDVIRVKTQVDNTSIWQTVTRLWRADGFRFVKKGLTARLTQSSVFSFWSILFYEPIKYISLKEEYAPKYTW